MSAEAGVPHDAGTSAGSGLVQHGRLAPTLGLKGAEAKSPVGIVYSWRIVCSSFLVMTCFPIKLGIVIYYPKRNYIGVSRLRCGYLDLQNGQHNGPYTAYTLYLGILGHYFGLFWRSRYVCLLTCVT